MLIKSGKIRYLDIMISSTFDYLILSFCVQILFVLVNVAESRNGRLMEYFRVRDFEAPLIRLVNLTDHVTYHLPSDTLTAEVIQEFCQSYLDGTAKVPGAHKSCLMHGNREIRVFQVHVFVSLKQPKMQSEPIPEDWDQKPVKELVGMNLEKVAFNPDKTVFVLFCM